MDKSVYAEKKPMAGKRFRTTVFSFVIMSLFLCSGPSESDTLDNKISNLSTITSSVTVDAPAAIQRIKSRSNLTRGPLVVGGVLSTTSGSTINLPVGYVASTFTVSSLQFDLVLPSSVSVLGVTAGPSATNAGKSVTFNAGRILVFGLNQTALGTGVLVTIQIKLATLAKGFYPINLINPVASDGAGNSLIISAVSGTVQIQ